MQHVAVTDNIGNVGCQRAARRGETYAGWRKLFGGTLTDSRQARTGRVYYVTLAADGVPNVTEFDGRTSAVNGDIGTRTLRKHGHSTQPRNR